MSPSHFMKRKRFVRCNSYCKTVHVYLFCLLTSLFINSSSVQLVKFSQAGQGRVSPVSEVDLGIYQLQRSEKLLEERVEALGQEVER